MGKIMAAEAVKHIPDRLFRMYVGLVRDSLSGALAVDLARGDAHARILDWVDETYGTRVHPAEFEIALSRRLDAEFAREFAEGDLAPRALRSPRRRRSQP